MTALVSSSSPTSPPDLETRVEQRKRELISEIVEHKKNSSRPGAAEAIDGIKARLSELSHIVKEGVVDGWANVGPAATLKLDEIDRKVTLDESRFRDESRFWSPEITRAFGSVIRAISNGPQSEVSKPEELIIETDVGRSDTQIVRGAD